MLLHLQHLHNTVYQITQFLWHLLTGFIAKRHSVFTTPFACPFIPKVDVQNGSQLADEWKRTTSAASATFIPTLVMRLFFPITNSERHEKVFAYRLKVQQLLPLCFSSPNLGLTFFAAIFFLWQLSTCDLLISKLSRCCWKTCS